MDCYEVIQALSMLTNDNLLTSEVEPLMKPKKSEPEGTTRVLGLVVENDDGVTVDVPSVHFHLIPSTVLTESIR